MRKSICIGCHAAQVVPLLCAHQFQKNCFIAIQHVHRARTLLDKLHFPVTVPLPVKCIISSHYAISENYCTAHIANNFLFLP